MLWIGELGINQELEERKKGKIKNGITRVYRTLKKLGENQKQI